MIHSFPIAKSTAKKRDTGASSSVIRHLKKAGRKKTTKAPKTINTESTQIFYSNTATFLETQISAKSTKSGGQSKLFTYYIDLGVIKGHLSEKDTMCLVQTSFTTSIDFNFFNDDDDVGTSMDAQVHLEILAYSGCDSAVTCKAAHITPSPLIPEKVELIGWYRDIDIDIDTNDIAKGLQIVEEFDWQDVMTSTNQATFLLAGKGAGDFFLQARISIQSGAYVNYGEASVDVLVHDWIVVVEEKDDDTSITESNGYTLSPTQN